MHWMESLGTSGLLLLHVFDNMILEPVYGILTATGIGTRKFVNV